jgi:hypothetical protein
MQALQWNEPPFQVFNNLRSIAIETFKIIHKESPIYLHDVVDIKKHNYSFRYENTSDVPSVKITRYGLKSFHYFSTKLKPECPFLNFLHFLSIFFTAKMPCYRTIIEVG